MQFSSFIFPSLFVLGLIFSALGCIFYFYPPKKINYWIGYRTPSSMKNQKNWDLAQRLSNRDLIILGIVLSILSFSRIFLPLDEKNSQIYEISLWILGIVILLIDVERELKKNG